MMHFVKDRISIQCGDLRRAACVASMCAIALFTATVASPANAQTLNLLHAFSGAPDGITSNAGLVRDKAGNLYGTTAYGGANGFGIVFKVDSTGKETVLHAFNGIDGAYPRAALIQDAAGTLYGASYLGGDWSAGTVFKLDPAGTVSVLYTFRGQPDASGPTAALIQDAAGNLYGTTSGGGPSNNGTVFKITPKGEEIILHAFGAGLLGPDGATPFGSLVQDSAGNLYGTTVEGGLPKCKDLDDHGVQHTVGCGTVFRVDPAGTETILYAFTDDAHGLNPYAGLVRDAAGNLYGTTLGGGDSSQGTLFKLDPAGTETVLHSFGPADGHDVLGALLMDSEGNLYGATNQTYGTVFKLDPAGAETLLYTFTGGTDGGGPSGLTLDAAGNLYGTTGVGGDRSCDLGAGCGTVFELVLAPDFSLSASALSPNTVTPGRSSTSSLNVMSINGFGDPVTLSCSVRPSPPLAPRCSITPASISPGSQATMTVSTMIPAAGVLRSSHDAAPIYAVWLPLITLALAVVGSSSGKAREAEPSAILLGCVLSVALAFQVACASGSASHASSTPAGTYTVTVTGTASNSLQHITTVVLTVE